MKPPSPRRRSKCPIIPAPLALSHFPFAFQHIEHACKYLDSPLLAELMEGCLQATGHAMPDGASFGARHVTANKAPTEHEHEMGA